MNVLDGRFEMIMGKKILMQPDTRISFQKGVPAKLEIDTNEPILERLPVSPW
jgi:hypothetical protein